MYLCHLFFSIQPKPTIKTETPSKTKTPNILWIQAKICLNNLSYEKTFENLKTRYTHMPEQTIKRKVSPESLKMLFLPFFSWCSLQHYLIIYWKGESVSFQFLHKPQWFLICLTYLSFQSQLTIQNQRKCIRNNSIYYINCLSNIQSIFSKFLTIFFFS